MLMKTAGYKVSVVEFENGEPVEPSTSLTGAVDIMSNADVTRCGDVDCFRPAGLAWDSQGRLFMSSDETGEIYAILRVDGNPTASAGSNATGTIPQSASGTGSGSEPADTGTASVASMSALAMIFAVLAFIM